MAVPGGGLPPTPGYSPGPRVRFDVIGEAWRLLQQQMGTWILAALVVFVGVFVVGFVAQIILGVVFGAAGSLGRGAAVGFGLANMLVQFILMLVIMVVMMCLVGGLFRMAIKQVRGEPIAVGDVFAISDVAAPLVLGALLTGIVIEIGMCLCVIPGLIAMGGLMFTIPLIVDRRLGAIEAMSTSWNTLKPDLVMAVLFAVVVYLIYAVGAAACFVGILVTAPLAILSIALLYRDFFMGPAPTPGVPPEPMPPTV